MTTPQPSASGHLAKQSSARTSVLGIAPAHARAAVAASAAGSEAGMVGGVADAIVMRPDRSERGAAGGERRAGVRRMSSPAVCHNLPMFLTRAPLPRALARPQGPRSQRGPAPPQALPSPAATAPGTHWAEATPSRVQWDALATALVNPVDAPAGVPVPATQALGDAPSLLVVTRSMGCPFCQELASALARDVVAPLTDAGVTLKLGERVGR